MIKVYKVTSRFWSDSLGAWMDYSEDYYLNELKAERRKERMEKKYPELHCAVHTIKVKE